MTRQQNLFHLHIIKYKGIKISFIAEVKLMHITYVITFFEQMFKIKFSLSKFKRKNILYERLYNANFVNYNLFISL